MKQTVFTEDRHVDNSDHPRGKYRVAIVVASVHHGNTLKIAKAIADEMHAEIFSPEEVTAHNLAEFGLVGFGSGIYFGRHHATIRRLVDSLDRVPALSFIFSTAGLPFLSPLFHRSLKRALTRRDSRIVGEFTCRGWDTVGPLFLVRGINPRHPDEQDLKRASDFARQLSEQSFVSGSGF